MREMGKWISSSKGTATDFYESDKKGHSISDDELPDLL
jgi:hypothetical protein